MKPSLKSTLLFSLVNLNAVSAMAQSPYLVSAMDCIGQKVKATAPTQAQNNDPQYDWEVYHFVTFQTQKALKNGGGFVNTLGTYQDYAADETTARAKLKALYTSDSGGFSDTLQVKSDYVKDANGNWAYYNTVTAPGTQINVVSDPAQTKGNIEVLAGVDGNKADATSYYYNLSCTAQREAKPSVFISAVNQCRFYAGDAVRGALAAKGLTCAVTSYTDYSNLGYYHVSAKCSDGLDYPVYVPAASIPNQAKGCAVSPTTSWKFGKARHYKK